MMIPGWCEKCRRVRQVRVTSQGMAMLAASRVAAGVCATCEQKEEDERRLRGR
jgi:hypothetical protein